MPFSYSSVLNKIFNRITNLSFVTFIMSEGDVRKDRHGSVQEAATEACKLLTNAGYIGEFEL